MSIQGYLVSWRTRATYVCTSCTLLPHELAFSPALSRPFFIHVERETDNERTSFSSQQRKRDHAYATTIIRAHEIIKNIRTYRYIIAEKKEYCFHVFERNFQTVRTFASRNAVKGRGAHLDNLFLNRLDFYICYNQGIFL